MAFSDLYIGDSQAMTAEAGVLGVPFIGFDDFVGKIGYLNDLEQKYELGYGIKPENEEELYKKVNELLTNPDRKSQWSKKLAKMLADKIAVDRFITELVENYPDSITKK